MKPSRFDICLLFFRLFGLLITYTAPACSFSYPYLPFLWARTFNGFTRFFEYSKFWTLVLQQQLRSNDRRVDLRLSFARVTTTTTFEHHVIYTSIPCNTIANA